MIYLILSVALSASLFLFFKWFDLKKIATLPAIAGNYIACIITGIIMNRGVNFEQLNTNIILSSLVLGILFFAIFYAMAYSSAKIGVGISSAAAKLSLMIPVTFGAIVLHEAFGILRIIALFLSIPAVVLMTFNKGEKWSLKALLIPLIIFIGSGIIDTSLNILQKNLNGSSPSSVIILIFSMALASSIVFSMVTKTNLSREYKSLSHGIILGIPNYFSVHFMMLALGSGLLSSGQFYLVNNSLVMLLSFFLAWVFFSEKINLYKVLGVVISIISIYLILFA
jgi:drug/metabolite transporter (DMT)-like permease